MLRKDFLKDLLATAVLWATGIALFIIAGCLQ